MNKPPKINGIIAGYDPGGNNSNGLALVTIENNYPVSITIDTLANAESVISKIKTYNIIGLGVDTLSCWCTGNSGWRPADLWLREKYPKVIKSIMSPNTLSGSMGINGMAVLIKAATIRQGVVLSETHPKVIHYALTGQKYDYKQNHSVMDLFLTKAFGGLTIKTSNDHEWDAAISAYALLEGMTGSWARDLHTLETGSGRMIYPCGKTYYFWPN